MPNVVSVAIIHFTRILRSPKMPGTDMAGCSLIYDLLLISYPVFKNFKEIFFFYENLLMQDA